MVDKNDELDELKGIRAKIVQHYIHIARVPKPTHDVFKDWANEEFCNDYGLCFKYMLDQCKEYQQMKKHMLKLIKILESKDDV